jgi:hypothetical protein
MDLSGACDKLGGKMRPLMLIVALWFCECNSDRITSLEKQNRELTAKLEAATKAANLDLQEKCAKGARDEFESQHWTGITSFTNHYRHTLNKCFIEVKNTDIGQKDSIQATIHTHF